MNFSHLRYITEVAKTGSITKAAQNLYMGQPNLSKAIREMEKNMGVAIFKRTSKGVEPTEKGREIVERARALIQSAEEFERSFCSQKDRAEKITVGICGCEYCLDIFEEAAAQWIDEYVFVEYFRSDRENIIGRVKNGEVSFGLVRFIGSRDDTSLKTYGISSRIFSESRGLIAVNKVSPLAEKDKIFDSDLKELIQIYISGGQPPQNAKNIGVSDIASGKKIIEKNSSCFMTISNLEASSYTSKSEKVVFRQIEPKVEIRDYLIYSEGRKFTAKEKELIEGCANVGIVKRD